MKYFIFVIVATLFLFVSPCNAQTTTYSTATVALGGNSWTGVTIPGGLKSGNLTWFTGMKQAPSVAPFCPTWIDIWGGSGIDDGQAVNWTLDVPQGPGHYHAEYSGTFHITWNWFFWCYQYNITYGVTTTYQ